MIEIILLVILSGVFWNYGKEMGAGKWIMILTFIGCSLAISEMVPVPILPVIGGAIITSILGITLSVMSDRQKAQRSRHEQATQIDPHRCQKCQAVLLPSTNRCYECGTSRIHRPR